MTAPTVFVVYASRSGGTAGIAEQIAQHLEEAGATVVLSNAESALPPDRADAVVLGSSVYMGRWDGDARRWAKNNRDALHELPVWLFSSGPLDETATKGEAEAPPGGERIASLVEAKEHMVFGGRLTEDSGGFVARKLIEQGRSGDYRDPGQIREWAGKIAAELGLT